MAITPDMRDLAQHLLAFETTAGMSSDATESATLRVYEKLRGNLFVIAGAAGFQSLASRAWTLASAQAPSFRTVQLAADGKLQRISEMKSPVMVDEDWNDQNGVILIASLLELLFLFLGKPLTMNLVRNVWPDEAFDYGSPGDGRKA